MAMLESFSSGKYYTLPARKKLGERVVELVNDPQVRKELTARNLLGVIKRYRNLEAADQSLRRAFEANHHGLAAAYTINDQSDEVIGIATVIPTLTLRKQGTGLPPKLLKIIGRHFTSPVNIGGPEVSAWTAELDEKTGRPLLKAAYTELLTPKGIADKVYSQWIFKQTDTQGRLMPDHALQVHNPWTIEPIDTHIAHDAIRAAGLSPAGNGYYDDQESTKLFPPDFVPVSRLYTRSPRQLDSQA